MFVIFFISQLTKKVKPWPLRFPAKENPNMEQALFDWPIFLQYDVKAKLDWFLESSWVFSPERLLNQPKATRVCIRSTNQSNRSISVLFARFHFKVIRKSLHVTLRFRNRCGVASYLYRNCCEITYVNRRPIRYGLNITLQKAVAFSVVKISRSIGDQHDGP